MKQNNGSIGTISSNVENNDFKLRTPGLENEMALIERSLIIIICAFY